MWQFIKGAYLAAEKAVAKGWVNLVTKNGKAYKAAAPASRGGMTMSASVKAQAGTRAIFATVGVTVAGWLSNVGITWGGKKLTTERLRSGF